MLHIYWRCAYKKKFDAEKNIFWQTDRVFNSAIFRQLHIVNNGRWCILCEINSELLLDLFSTLQICYRHIEDVHDEVWCLKKIFLTNWQGFELSHFTTTAHSKKWFLVVLLRAFVTSDCISVFQFAGWGYQVSRTYCQTDDLYLDVVLFLFCVALWFLLWGISCWVLPCSLFLCFFSPFSIETYLRWMKLKVLWCYVLKRSIISTGSLRWVLWHR